MMPVRIYILQDFPECKNNSIEWIDMPWNGAKVKSNFSLE
jgi:hypothetical protein